MYKIYKIVENRLIVVLKLFKVDSEDPKTMLSEILLVLLLLTLNLLKKNSIYQFIDLLYTLKKSLFAKIITSPLESR